MNARKTLVGVAALCALCLAVVVVVSSADAQLRARPTTNDGPSAPAIVGRFKLELGVTGVGNYMCDTTNGECWHWNGKSWEAMDIPKSAAAK